MGSGHKKKRNTAAAERRRVLENLFYFITYPLLTYNIFIPSIDSSPAAGRGSDMFPFRLSAIIAFSPYGKFGELSYMVKKRLRHFNLFPSSEGISYMDSGVKRSVRQCRLADCTKEYCASGFCTMERRLKNRGSQC